MTLDAIQDQAKSLYLLLFTKLFSKCSVGNVSGGRERIQPQGAFRLAEDDSHTDETTWDRERVKRLWLGLNAQYRIEAQVNAVMVGSRITACPAHTPSGEPVTAPNREVL